MSALSFEISDRAADCGARVGRVTTAHGSFDTPAFMPVGTQATIKGMYPQQIGELGAQIVLANTYHLMLRPGSELIAKMGGLQKWTRWGRPMLTDSGGFQVFSLADVNRIDDEGVMFKSHLDGSMVHLTPQRSIQVQNELGADIIMAFDDCPPARDEDVADDAPAKRHAVAAGDYAARVQQSCERSARWLDACVAAHGRADEQALFGIVQGGTDLAQRDWCVDRVCSHDLPGFAIGGVAVGEGYEGLKTVVEHTAPRMPDNKPRYLMGVGYERDILAAVRAGVDMFDCVLPTRNARNANAFTPTGQMRLRNAQFADDPRPIDETCDCIACGGNSGGATGGATGGASGGTSGGTSGGGGFSRSYIRHLFAASEMLGPMLVTAHNLRHFQRYLLDIRRAIADNGWSLLARRWPVAFD